MKKLEIKIGKRIFWMLLLAISLLFFTFVLAVVPENPRHLANEILVDVPANADCSFAGQESVSLQDATDDRCFMVDGDTFVPQEGGVCRICKNSCGGPYWGKEIGMITSYGGTEGGVADDDDVFGLGKYRFYPSGCGNPEDSVGSLVDYGWGKTLKVCCYCNPDDPVGQYESPCLT